MTDQKATQNSLAADALYNTVGNIVYLFCLWIITVLVVRLSGYDDAGVLSVAMTTSNVFFVVANYGMRSFQASDVSCEYSDQQYVFSRIITVAIGVFLCAGFAVIYNYNAIQGLAIFLFMLFKAVEAFSDVLYGVMQRGHSLKNAGISLIAKGICAVIGFSVGLIISGSLIFALTAMLVSSALITIFYDIPHMKRVSKNIFIFTAVDKKRSLILLKACFAMFVVSIAPMILQAIPRLSFEKMYSVSELGIFSSIAAPTVVLSTLVSCILIPYLPRFASAVRDDDRMGLLKLLLISVFAVLLLGSLACLVAWLLGGWALTLLYGKNLYQYRDLLIYVIISVSLTNLLYCLNALFISGRKIPILAVVYVGADVLCYLIAERMIHDYGIFGITASLNFTQMMQCLALSVLCIPLFFMKGIRRSK